MITINLLPTKQRRVDAAWFNQVLIVGGAAILCVACAAAVVYYQSVAAEKQSTLDDLLDQQEALQAEVDEVERLQQQIAALQERKDVLEDLFYSGPEWSRKLNQISDLVPARVWMETLRVETEQVREQQTYKQKLPDGRERTRRRTVMRKKTYLYLTGVTADVANGLTLVAEFKSRLENSPFWKDLAKPDKEGKPTREIEILSQSVEPWLQRGSPADQLPVWRFTFKMEVDRGARKPSKTSAGNRVASTQ